MAWVPEKTGLPIVDRVLQRLAAVIKRLEGNPLYVYSIKRDLVLSPTEVKVYHGLGRPISGRIVIAQNVSTDVYDGSASTAPEAFVWMRTSGPGSATVDILFF